MSSKSGKPRVPGNPARRAQQEQPAGARQVPVSVGGQPLQQSQLLPTQPGPPPDVMRMLSERLQRLVNQNIRDIQALQARGIGFNQAQVLDARIDHLIGCIARAFGPEQGPVWELQTKVSFEESMAENIRAAQAEGTKAQLAMGGSLSATAIRDLARQTGTFGGR